MNLNYISYCLSAPILLELEISEKNIFELTFTFYGWRIAEKFPIYTAQKQLIQLVPF